MCSVGGVFTLPFKSNPHTDTRPIICTVINLLVGLGQLQQEDDENDDGFTTGATNRSGSTSRGIGKQDDDDDGDGDGRRRWNSACAAIMNELHCRDFSN